MSDISNKYATQAQLALQQEMRTWTVNENDLERPLPVGMTEFNEFAGRIIAKAGAYADEDSMKFALASIVIHADATKAHYSDNYFLERLRKSAANQVASQVFQDIKAKQAEALAKQQAEAPAEKEVVANEVQKS